MTVQICGKRSSKELPCPVCAAEKKKKKGDSKSKGEMKRMEVYEKERQLIWIHLQNYRTLVGSYFDIEQTQWVLNSLGVIGKNKSNFLLDLFLFLCVISHTGSAPFAKECCL